jgi:outer membrane protein TolC
MRLAMVCCLSVCAVARADMASAQAVPAITEHEAVARFTATDPRLRAMAARVDEIRAAQAERAPWPNPSFTYSREHVFNSGDTFWLGRQELPLSGRIQRLRAAGQLAVEAAAIDAQRELLALQAEVRRAHVDLLFAQARAAELQRGIEALQQLIEVLRAREREGEGSQYDRMRGERAMLDLRAEAANAAAMRAEAQGRLASFIGAGTAPESLIAAGSLEVAVARPAVTALVDRAMSGRSEFRAAQLSISQYETERSAASRLRVPTPTVTAGLKRGTTPVATSSGYQFSVDVGLPIFNHGAAAHALATAQKARAEAELAWWRARIDVEVRTAAAVLTIQQQRLEQFRQEITSVVEPLARIGRVGYDEGELGILELLDAERQALEARLRVIELGAAARRAAIELDRAIGLEMKP